jgi:hypothetical protein
MVNLRLLTLALPLLVGGCGASVAGANPAGIWFDEPFIGGWDEAAVAAKHCASYGKTAVYRGRLLTNISYATPVAVYDCQ